MDNKKLENKAVNSRKKKDSAVKCIALVSFLGYKKGDPLKVPSDKFDYMKSRGYVKK